MGERTILPDQLDQVRIPSPGGIGRRSRGGGGKRRRAINVVAKISVLRSARRVPSVEVRVSDRLRNFVYEGIYYFVRARITVRRFALSQGEVSVAYGALGVRLRR